MINSLKIKNWRTHADTTLEYGKGTNVIIGVMGSGKSSIVNAISYSLFGTFPQLKSKQVSLKEIIMNRPNQTDKSEVIVEFNHGENKYRAERIIKLDGTNEAKLYENEKFICGPKQKDVNEKIEKILGMDYELFSRAVYAEQNELDFFLKLSPSERKKKFDELLQLEKYEIARKNSTTLQNDLIKETKQQKELLQRQQEMLKGHEEEKLVNQINDAKKEIEELSKKAQLSKEELSKIENEYKIICEKEKKFKEINEKIIKNKARIETLTEDINKKSQLKETLEEISKNVEEKQKGKDTIKNEVSILEKKAKEEDEKQKKESEEIRVLEYRAKKIEEEMKAISGLKGNCPTCKQLLDERHKAEIIDNMHNEMQKILQEKKKHEEERFKLLDNFKSFERELNENRKKYENEEKEIIILQNKEKELKELQEKKTILSNLLSQAPNLEREKEEIGFDKEIMDKLRERYFEKKNESELFISKAKSKEELVRSYQETLSKINQIKESMKQTEIEISKMESASKKAGLFSNCLVATQTELRQEMLQTINEAMSDIWKEIYPYGDFINARLSVVEDGYDLEVLTRNGNWTRVEGILSGGERSAAALCIRMAFALVLTKNLSMLILDEPTHNLDTNTVTKLSEMLREKMPALVDQIFVITHDKQLEAAASSSLYILQRDKGNDEATRVETIQIEKY